MAKNEDGEFELILGNNQLLSVFFLMVLLLAVCFIGGYMVGRSTAPMIASTSTAAPFNPTSSPKVEVQSETKHEAEPAPTPVTTAAQAEPEPAKPEPVKEAPKAEPPKEVAKAKEAPKAKEQAKAEPPKEAPKAKEQAKAAPPSGGALPPLGSQPIPGRTYLQLSATEKDKAEAMADLVRRANLPAIAAAITDRPGLYRVLVGPIPDTAVAETKAKLKSSGFPGDDAIRRVF